MILSDLESLGRLSFPVVQSGVCRAVSCRNTCLNLHPIQKSYLPLNALLLLPSHSSHLVLDEIRRNFPKNLLQIWVLVSACTLFALSYPLSLECPKVVPLHLPSVSLLASDRK